MANKNTHRGKSPVTKFVKETYLDILLTNYTSHFALLQEV